MALTPAQLPTLKAAMLAETDAAVIAAVQGGNATYLAGWYNGLSSPAFVVWRPTVPSEEIDKAINYVAVAAMTTANLDRVNNFLNLNPEEFDPSRSDIRTFMSDTFSGALGGQGQATRDAIEALYRRTAKRGEKVYATGIGSTATPGILTFEGDITIDDVGRALSV